MNTKAINPNLVLMIGQFPPSITGESVCNEAVYKILKTEGLAVHKINSEVTDNPNNVGRLSWAKLVISLRLLTSCIRAASKADLIYVTPGQSFLGILRFSPLFLYFSLFRKKTILHWHGYGILENARLLRFLRPLLANSYTTNIFLTKDVITKTQGIKLKKTCVLKNFTELPAFDPQLKAEKKNISVLYLGSLMPEKGFLNFINVARKLVEIDFHICGAGAAEHTNTAIQAASLPNVHYHGTVTGNEKLFLLRSADVFVLQTYYKTEGVPLSILDAMSQSCAILTTIHNGIPETIGDSAFYIEKDSENSLSDALLQINANRAQLRELQAKAYLMSKQYSFDAFKSNLLSIVHSNLEKL